MTRYAAFLRGVNLGKRTVRSADLKAAFAAMGFDDAETLIASGNVVFSAKPEPGLASRIEKGLHQAFGFEIGTVLRTHAELEEMIRSDPFAAVPNTGEAKLYVSMLHEPIGRTLTLPYGVEGNFDVLSVTDTNIFAVAWKMPNGRYGEGLDALEKQFPKRTLITTRNWNTILKAAGKTAKDLS